MTFRHLCWLILLAGGVGIEAICVSPWSPCVLPTTRYLIGCGVSFFTSSTSFAPLICPSRMTTPSPVITMRLLINQPLMPGCGI